MDLTSFELSLYAATIDEGHTGTLSHWSSHLFPPPGHRLRWTSDVAHFAQSGIPQAAILAISVSWASWSLLYRRKSRLTRRLKAPSIGWRYETLPQISRAASLALLAVACAQGRTHWLNTVVLAYGFVLGLLRLVRDLDWSHAALHQVNFVSFSMLLVLLISQFLPCVEIGAECRRGASVIGGIIALSVVNIVAVSTPREWLPPPTAFEIRGRDADETPSLEETCSWFNYYCSYEWITPLIWKGTKRTLDMSGIPKLPWYDEPLYLLRRIQHSRSISGKTMGTVLRYQRKELSLMAIYVASAYILENVAPYSMFKLLDYLASPETATYQPWVWLILVFIGPMSRSVFFQQYIFTSTRLVVRIKSAMTQELYHRALASMELEDDPFDQNVGTKGSAQAEKPTNRTTSAGRLATLMAADIDALYRARDVIIVGVGVPAGTIVSVIGMYRMLGWPSIVGIALIILATPVSYFLGHVMYGRQALARRAQDSRLSLVTEYLSSIRAIKYFAWEDAITDNIIHSRAREQKQLWQVAILQTLINQVSQVPPLLALLVMFGLHIGVKRKSLDASVAFTTLYLVRNIRRNIMQGSWFARSFTAAMVAAGRLDTYFESTVPKVDCPEGPLQVQAGYFRRTKKATFRLEDISLDFVEGGLNVVSGQSGSGKTTLLLSILGETYLEGGSMSRPRDVAFASQTAWLQNDTVRSNILFGSPMEQARYDRVVEACCLQTDLDELSDGEFTIVGENGTSLSGGQKARVALARALYSKAPLLLLDDIFSALDTKTAARLWQHCFCSDMLSGRTTVLVTQIPWIPPQADLTVTLEQGRVKRAEQNISAVRQPITIAEVLGGDEDESQPATPSEPNSQRFNGRSKVGKDKIPNDLVDQETKASGRIGRLTFLQYMSYFGHPLFATACLVALFLSGLLSFYSTYWLSIWVEAYGHGAHVDIAYYLGIFALLNLLEISFIVFVSILFEWGAWRAARKLHNDFVRAVMRVSLSWYKTIPVGRITNRFAGDMASIDGQLSTMLRFSLESATTLLFRIAAVSTIMPIFIVPALFTCFFGMVLAEMYTRTAVVAKRLVSSAQSPVFSQFADTLAGLAVVRGREGMAQAFRDELAAKLRVWSAAAEAQFNCNRWVSVRVDFVTALVALCAGIIAVSKVGLVGAGLVGFSLTNANGLSQTILALVRGMNDLEVEIQSFHRVKEYVKLEHEEKYDEPYPEEGGYADDETHVIPKSWPRSGEIEFRNVTIRYDPDGPNILTDVNLKFKAGERVAIVGRTGSGKSTLVLSLLRFTHVVSGQILYDGIDITNIPRHRLRESLTIIPQEAVLFNGSVESNLDPTGLVPPADLKETLDRCKTIPAFSGTSTPRDGAPLTREHTDSIKLSTEVDARGENFSHGQRQVLSLCRALVRRSKLMLLDEATASMDYETDRGIQEVLREELEAADHEDGGGRTLVTIAHRLRTIIDYDSIVVMAAGRVVENGSPRDLYDAKGLFYDMVLHSGEMEDLQGLLGEGSDAPPEEVLHAE